QKKARLFQSGQIFDFYFNLTRAYGKSAAMEVLAGLCPRRWSIAPTGLFFGRAFPRAYESVTKRGARSWKNAMFGNSGHRFLLFPSDLDWRAQLASQGMLQLDCAENIQHACQVVDHTSQTDLRLRASHPAEQETRVSEYAVLQRGERMFDGGSS